MGKPVSDVLTQSSVQTGRTDAQAAVAIRMISKFCGDI